MSSLDIFPSTSPISSRPSVPVSADNIKVGSLYDMEDVPDLNDMIGESIGETMNEVVDDLQDVATQAVDSATQAVDSAATQVVDSATQAIDSATQFIPPSQTLDEVIPEEPTTSYFGWILQYWPQILLGVLILIIVIGGIRFYNDILKIIDDIKTFIKDIFSFGKDKKEAEIIKKTEEDVEDEIIKKQARKGDKKYCYLGKNENGKSVCAPVVKNRKCQSGVLMYESDCVNI